MGGEWSASRPGRALPRGKDPRYPLYRRLGGPQSRSGHRGYMKNPLPLLGIKPRSPGGPARSQTLYCLSYPGSYKTREYIVNISVGRVETRKHLAIGNHDNRYSAENDLPSYLGETVGFWTWFYFAEVTEKYLKAKCVENMWPISYW
jgi:hypothetical protein